jgi:hypothetical protein
MEKISWTDRVQNEVLHRVRREGISYMQLKKRRANWIGQILHNNCILKHVIEGKIEGRINMTGRQGRRRKQLLSTLRKREDTGY